MKITNKAFIAALVLACASSLGGTSPTVSEGLETAARIEVLFIGGYATDPRDHGRPVVLIAAALPVTPEVFRDAFSRVKPAPAGEAPEPGQVSRNKQVLLSRLGLYGITNERLDEVSNYYRYDGRRQKLWRHTPATAFATVRHGVITRFTITDPGSGYTTAPKIQLPGRSDLNATAILSLGTNLLTNGSIKAITVGGVK